MWTILWWTLVATVIAICVCMGLITYAVIKYVKWIGNEVKRNLGG